MLLQLSPWFFWVDLVILSKYPLFTFSVIPSNLNKNLELSEFGECRISKTHKKLEIFCCKCKLFTIRSHPRREFAGSGLLKWWWCFYSNIGSSFHCFHRFSHSYNWGKFYFYVRKKKSGKNGKIKAGPRGFGQKIEEFEDDSSSSSE